MWGEMIWGFSQFLIFRKFWGEMHSSLMNFMFLFYLNISFYILFYNRPYYLYIYISDAVSTLILLLFFSLIFSTFPSLKLTKQRCGESKWYTYHKLKVKLHWSLLPASTIDLFDNCVPHKEKWAVYWLN